MRKLLFGLLACFIFQQYASAQGVVLKGIVKDTSEKKLLFNAVVSLVQKKDSILVNFTRTNKEGQFQIEWLSPGKYLMLITYPKFADFGEEIEVRNTDIDLGNIALTHKSLLLKEVIVRTGQ
ncbi:MAG TPA: carboxypeptidase regulatory-like domain-containing protein, partial [Chitinophagaceae bacterium]|nr:carboxypeptidase regulatory-like domain-containing protein [Chitinophagaceae bacterium]